VEVVLLGGLVIRYAEISQQPRESDQCAQIAGVAVILIRQHDVSITSALREFSRTDSNQAVLLNKHID
jgi:hypothetical protein